MNLDFSNPFIIAITVYILLHLGDLFEVLIQILRDNFTNRSRKASKATKAKLETKGSAKNSKAVNAAKDFQKIETAEIEVPVIAADVLTYGPGELGTAYPEETKLYYSPEALEDEEYLETVRRSPFQVQTHEKNTTEFNRDVDGWPREVWWDKDKKKVIAKGYVHGKENVEYVKENKGKPTFGTSAFISFLKVDKTPGVSPEGKPYDAIVRKAVNNHIAILPNVRDPKNVILAMNALEETKKEENESKNEDKPSEMAEEKKRMPIDPEEFKSAMDAYMSAKQAEEAKMAALKNELKEELKDEKNAKNEEEKKKEEAENKAKNEEEKKKEEEESASNALPSEEMVKDFSEALGLTFKKTPSLKELAGLAGVSATNTAELVTALNAKRTELKKGVSSTETEAKNSSKSTMDFLREV